MTLSYPVVIVEEKSKFWAYIPDVPGVYGVGKTSADAREDIVEAIKLYVKDCREAGDKIPHSLARIVGFDKISVKIAA